MLDRSTVTLDLFGNTSLQGIVCIAVIKSCVNEPVHPRPVSDHHYQLACPAAKLWQTQDISFFFNSFMTEAKDEIDSELIVCGPQNTARLTVFLSLLIPSPPLFIRCA